MGGGWLRNPKDGWTYRFQRDEKSWLQDPFVIVDKGRAMPDGLLRFKLSNTRYSE